jgi:hypothetical protein
MNYDASRRANCRRPPSQRGARQNEQGGGRERGEGDGPGQQLPGHWQQGMRGFVRRWTEPAKTLSLCGQSCELFRCAP